MSFEFAALSKPPLEPGDHEAVPAVREFLQEEGEQTIFRSGGALRLLAEGDGQALFAVGDTSEDFATLRFAERGDGWEWENSRAGCPLQGWARGRPASPWSSAEEVGPGDTRVEALVEEITCASGEPARGRIDPPHIERRPEAVVVTITVRKRPGSQTCPGNPPTPFTFELREALGDRVLLDGFHVPPAPPGSHTPLSSSDEER